MDAEEAAAPAEHLDLVAEFCSITDAGPDVAASLLAAADYQLDAAVDLFFNDPGAVQPLPPAAALLHPPPAAAAAAAQQQHDYVEILDDDDDEDDAGLAELARQRQRALAARQQAEDAMDDELAVVGTAAGRPPSQAAAAGASAPGAAAPMDLADDDMAAVAAAVAADGGQDQHADFASYHRRQQEELMSMYQRQAARQQAAALQPASATAGGASSDGGGGGDAAGEGGAGVAAGAGAAGGFPDDEPLDLPAGINLEEARMLEAAMLGVPYAGRIPDFTAAAPAQPLSPGTLEQHAIRREQDQAYEESLALDRAKQESIEAAAAEAEAAERAQQEAEAAAAAEAASAAQALSQLLASKKARLPPEPSGAGSVQVVVRLPSGSRKGRRFLPSDPLQAVFDYVDVECAAVGPEAEASGSGVVKPGQYRLVTQFPRKVLTEGGSGSLQDAGISTDTALFIEPLL